MSYGFRPEDDDLSEPTHVGDVGQLTENGSNDDEGSISFTHHVYIQISIGPFTLVVGRPD